MSSNRKHAIWYGTVYLLHFSEPYYHARHYVGWTANEGKPPFEAAKSRLEDHLDGFGSPLVRSVHTHGIMVVVARVWGNKTRSFERRVHNRRPKSVYCPLCQGTTTVTQPALSIA